MDQFGRSLKEQPLRKDFDLSTRLISISDGKNVLRSVISRGEVAYKQIVISVEASADCYLTILYVLPAKLALNKGETCLLIFPNVVERDQRLLRGKKRTILDHPRTLLVPVATSGEAAYLYLMATEKDWTIELDSESNRNGFFVFSPAATKKLAARIGALLADTHSTSSERPNRIAEDIFIFNVDKKQAGQISSLPSRTAP
jgi:hypothetical protein